MSNSATFAGGLAPGYSFGRVVSATKKNITIEFLVPTATLTGIVLTDVTTHNIQNFKEGDIVRFEFQVINGKEPEVTACDHVDRTVKYCVVGMQPQLDRADDDLNKLIGFYEKIGLEVDLSLESFWYDFVDQNSRAGDDEKHVVLATSEPGMIERMIAVCNDEILQSTSMGLDVVEIDVEDMGIEPGAYVNMRQFLRDKFDDGLQEIDGGWLKVNGIDVYVNHARNMFNYVRGFVSEPNKKNEALVISLEGESGSGKTMLAQAVAAFLGDGFTFTKVSVPLILDPIHLFGEYAVKDMSTEFEVTKFLQNFQKGNAVILLDEINRTPQDMLNPLMNVLDHTGTIQAASREWQRGENVIFIVTGNYGPQYGGTFQLDEALRNRFDATYVINFPSLSVIAEMIRRLRYSTLDDDMISAMVEHCGRIREIVNKTGAYIDVSTRAFVKVARSYHYQLLGINRDVMNDEDAQNRLLSETLRTRFVNGKPKDMAGSIVDYINEHIDTRTWDI